jgi:hypothetical protein
LQRFELRGGGRELVACVEQVLHGVEGCASLVGSWQGLPDRLRKTLQALVARGGAAEGSGDGGWSRWGLDDGGGHWRLLDVGGEEGLVWHRVNVLHGGELFGEGNRLGGTVSLTV